MYMKNGFGIFSTIDKISLYIYKNIGIFSTIDKISLYIYIIYIIYDRRLE